MPVKDMRDKNGKRLSFVSLTDKNWKKLSFVSVTDIKIGIKWLD